jgi:hypothetical protein
MKYFVGHLSATWKLHSSDINDLHTQVAVLATKLLNAFNDRCTGLPQMINNDHHSWSVDANNDWWLIFDQDDPYSFEFRHRYNTDENEQVRKALTYWFAYRISGTTVDEIER